MSRDYAKYLRSRAWRKRAFRAKVRAGWKCEQCGHHGRDLEAHHKTYVRLGREWPEDIVVLCAKCHKEAHKDMTDRNKMPVVQKQPVVTVDHRLRSLEAQVKQLSQELFQLRAEDGAGDTDAQAIDELTKEMAKMGTNMAWILEKWDYITNVLRDRAGLPKYTRDPVKNKPIID